MNSFIKSIQAVFFAIAITMIGWSHSALADTSFGKIQVFTYQGHLLMPMGRFDQEDLPGNFAMIAGIAADEAGRLYVVDQFFKRISIFSPEPGLNAN